MIKVIFLGTNGWYDTKFGDTVCTLILTPRFSIILDAGNGFSKLEKYIDWEKPAFLFLSHFHLDHIFGLHTLVKCQFKKEFTIFGQIGTKKILKNFLSSPFTVPFQKLPFKLKIEEILEEKRKIFGFFVKSKFLLHADPVLGYQFKINNKKITYCTDTGDCKNLRILARKSDLFITECALKPGIEYPHWPHLDPVKAAKIAKKEKAKKLVLTHFDPYRFYPTKKERIWAEKEAKKIFKNSISAFDGLEIVL